MSLAGIEPRLNKWVKQRTVYAVGGYARKQRNGQCYRENGRTDDLRKFAWIMRSHVVRNHEVRSSEDATEEETD